MAESFDQCYQIIGLAESPPSDDQDASQTHNRGCCMRPEDQFIAPKLMHIPPVDAFLLSLRPLSFPCGMKHLSDVNVELGSKGLWTLFHAEEHEMKITKTGRLLFPVLKLKVSGLSSDEKYSLSVNFTNVNSVKYRYFPDKNEWYQSRSTTESDATTMGRRLYDHPSSPALGSYWTIGLVEFDKLRLTNDWKKTDKHMIQLSTLRKYRIQVIIAKLSCSECHQPHVRMFELPLTEFIAVTGYRNKKISQLKINTNPLAAAFREDYKEMKAQSRKRKRDACRSSKKLKTEDVITAPLITRDPSREESKVEELCKTSCCNTPDTLTRATPSVDLDKHVASCRQNDVIIYPQFHQPLYPYQDMKLTDIPQFQIPEINPKHPTLIYPSFQSQEQCTYDHYDCQYDQSYCHNFIF